MSHLRDPDPGHLLLVPVSACRRRHVDAITASDRRASTYTDAMPMDWDGKVENPKLVCAISHEPIAAGATFWSALTFAEGHFLRSDYSEAAWDQVDRAGLISWWRQRAPTPDGPEAKPIDIEALFGIFHALKDETDRAKQCFAYVVLLFLVRARKLRFKEVLHDADGSSQILVEDKQVKCLYRVRDPGLSPEEEAAVQANLLEIMGGSAPVRS